MEYVWDDAYKIGDPHVDEQHEKLFEVINNLMHACQLGTHRKELQNTLDFLLDYVVQHFADEEALQRRVKYPDYANHRLLHIEFTNTAVDLAKQLEADGFSIALMGEVYSLVGQWLQTHIQGEDMKIGHYLTA